jgi:hypothetical protein
MMRTATATRANSEGRRLPLLARAALLSLLAGATAYFGLAVAFAIILSNSNAKAVSIGIAYLLSGFGAPIATGFYFARSRGWDWTRAISFAAAVSLLIHGALVPVALAALAM